MGRTALASNLRRISYFVSGSQSAVDAVHGSSLGRCFVFVVHVVTKCGPPPCGIPVGYASGQEPVGITFLCRFSLVRVRYVDAYVLSWWGLRTSLSSSSKASEVYDKRGERTRHDRKNRGLIYSFLLATGDPMYKYTFSMHQTYTTKSSFLARLFSDGVVSSSVSSSRSLRRRSGAPSPDGSAAGLFGSGPGATALSDPFNA